MDTDTHADAVLVRTNNITYNLLLQGKDIVVEELVELLVRVVDAQLLK